MSSLLFTSEVVQVLTVTENPPINNENFQGYYIHTDDNSTEPINCPDSQTLQTTKNYAQCCNKDTVCSVMWTSCHGSYPVAVATDTCATGLFCQTLSIFAQFPTINQPVHTQIMCGPSNWAAFSIYRAIVTVESSTVLTTFTASQASSSSIASAATGLSVQSGVVSSSNSNSGTSKAWIAGAVVGPVILIPIVAILLWLLLKKRKQETDIHLDLPVPASSAGYGYQNVSWSPSGVEAYMYESSDQQQKRIYEVNSTYPNEVPLEMLGS